MAAAQLLVVVRRRTLQRQRLRPPLHDAVVLREEAVAADVHAVAIVAYGARDAAELLAFLEHRHVVARVAAILDQFPSGSQPGGAAADDDYGFLVRHAVALL